jgi:hypothetical protein
MALLDGILARFIKLAGTFTGNLAGKTNVQEMAEVFDVFAGGPGGGISHATADGKYYASKDGDWADIAGGFLPLTITETTQVDFPLGNIQFWDYGDFYITMEDEDGYYSYMNLFPTYVAFGSIDTSNVFYSVEVNGGMGKIRVYGAPFNYESDLTSAMTTDRHIPDIGKVKEIVGSAKRISVTAADGATPAIDCDSGTEVYVKWEAGTASTAPSFSNVVVDSVIHLSMKKTISGDVVATFSQSGYVFALEGEATAASKAVTLTGDQNAFFSVILTVTAHEISGDKVVTIAAK